VPIVVNVRSLLDRLDAPADRQFHRETVRAGLLPPIVVTVGRHLRP